MKHPVFFIGEELSDKTRQWLHRQQIQYIEQPLNKIEELASRAFDGYLFFSPKGISRFKSSGNFHIHFRWFLRMKIQQLVLPGVNSPIKYILHPILKNCRLFNTPFIAG